MKSASGDSFSANYLDMTHTYCICMARMSGEVFNLSFECKNARGLPQIYTEIDYKITKK